MPTILYTEKQHFTQWWLGLLLLMVNVITFCVADWVAGVILAALLVVYFVVLCLQTEIRDDGVYVRFFPFHLRMKHWAWSEIERVEVVKYSPLADYGGWGIRLGRKGKAYNVRGDMGMLIYLRKGGTILVGTQRPDEIREILKQLKDKDIL